MHKPHDSSSNIHTVFVFFLFFLGILSVSIIGLKGCSYYLIPIAERPYHADYDLWKPTGFIGHGLGFLGTAMIILGVSTYSSRKRIRAISSWGKISYWLEFHIFLCLVGPIFIVYHTTFKFGGIVAVSFWSMTAVMLSGIVGRYLYVQIPKNIRGVEMTIEELLNENFIFTKRLREEYKISEELFKRMEIVVSLAREKSQTLLGVFEEFFLKGSQRRNVLQLLQHELVKANISTHEIKNIVSLTRKKIILEQRIALLEGTRKLFHYWHVIHLPFTIVMFIILAIHIIVAFLFGYRWIF
ncbi:MAG: hypothetical protein FJ218_01110 [Ignavibacteria bacterium]|nr:hypothetical protein [Ignavibacteria bacterium]